MHHPKRYERFPVWLAIGFGESSAAEKQTFINLTHRNALNMRPERFLAMTVTNRDDLKSQTEELRRFLEVSS